MEYKIKYLRTTEEFEIIVPDPLNDSETIKIKISDYDLYNLINSGKQNDLDDDTFLGITKLQETHVLSVNVLKLAKRQCHLRRLNRIKTSWLILKSKKRNPKKITNENLERIQYLRENFDLIAKNCVKHDWFDEYYRLCKDTRAYTNKKDIVESWKNLKYN